MIITLPDARLDYYPEFYTQDESITLMDLLIHKVIWQQNKIKMFGKIYDEPRLTSWFSDDGLIYTYSGIQLSPNAWIAPLKDIKERIESLSGMDFNSALLNYYRDGSDSMGWHQDNERELGQNPAIASVTFGATRMFQLKHLQDKSQPIKSIPLTNGSLMIMHGPTQHYWKHQIPKTKKLIGPRLNITLRKIISS